VRWGGGEENTATAGGGSSSRPSVSETEAGAVWERNWRGSATVNFVVHTRAKWSVRCSRSDGCFSHRKTAIGEWAERPCGPAH
jgi:hypothetical protein